MGTPEKTNLHKIEASAEQVVPVFVDLLPVQFLRNLQLRVIPRRFIYHEPFRKRGLAPKFNGINVARAF